MEAVDEIFDNEVTYTGSITDTSTGLQYMNARYYDSSTGRFLTQDTYTGNVYEPWTQHLYTYCGNNPTNMVDPTGHVASWFHGNGRLSEYTDTDTGTSLRDKIAAKPAFIQLQRNGILLDTGTGTPGYNANTSEDTSTQSGIGATSTCITGTSTDTIVGEVAGNYVEVTNSTGQMEMDGEEGEYINVGSYGDYRDITQPTYGFSVDITSLSLGGYFTQGSLVGIEVGITIDNTTYSIGANVGPMNGHPTRAFSVYGSSSTVSGNSVSTTTTSVNIDFWTLLLLAGQAVFSPQGSQAPNGNMLPNPVGG